MTDGVALLRAILTNPEEDMPRLVLADWLEENGCPERAEFVRVQVELARLEATTELDDRGWPVYGHGGENGYCEACEPFERLRGRKAALLGLYYGDWSAQLHQAIGCPQPHVHSFAFDFARGFVAKLTCTAEAWRGYHERLYWHPAQRVWCGRRTCHNGAVATNAFGWRECAFCKPRPCPETAQPIERVTLTTEPDDDRPWEWYWDGKGQPGPAEHRWKSCRWPGIVFELPIPASTPASTPARTDRPTLPASFRSLR
jgi:uncharacterized protein (TIGR02996 family)